MTTKRIREKFHRDHIADKATAIAREKAGGDELLLRAGVLCILIGIGDAAYEEIVRQVRKAKIDI